MTTSVLPMTPFVAERLRGHPLMLLLDIDGTLAPIAPRPAEAAVPEATRRVLDELARLHDVRVAVVSGRSADDSRQMVCLDDVWIIGNHGIEVAPPNGAPIPRAEAAPFADRLARAAERITDLARGVAGVIVEDKRWTLSIHYRVADAAVVPELAARVTDIARDLGLRVTRGKEVLEVRPPIEVDKGTAAVDLAEALGALHDGASLLCAGDDRTDEDMFRALRDRQPRCVTVRVGHNPGVDNTAAEFALSDPAAMRALLETVLSLRLRSETLR